MFQKCNGFTRVTEKINAFTLLLRGVFRSFKLHSHQVSFDLLFQDMSLSEHSLNTGVIRKVASFALFLLAESLQ